MLKLLAVINGIYFLLSLQTKASVKREQTSPHSPKQETSELQCSGATIDATSITTSAVQVTDAGAPSVDSRPSLQTASPETADVHTLQSQAVGKSAQMPIAGELYQRDISPVPDGLGSYRSIPVKVAPRPSGVHFNAEKVIVI